MPGSTPIGAAIPSFDPQATLPRLSVEELRIFVGRATHHTETYAEPGMQDADRSADSVRHHEAVAHAGLGDQQLGHGGVVELTAETGDVDPEVVALVLRAGSPDPFE